MRTAAGTCVPACERPYHPHDAFAQDEQCSARPPRISSITRRYVVGVLLSILPCARSCAPSDSFISLVTTLQQAILRVQHLHPYISFSVYPSDCMCSEMLLSSERLDSCQLRISALAVLLPRPHGRRELKLHHFRASPAWASVHSDHGIGRRCGCGLCQGVRSAKVIARSGESAFQPPSRVRTSSPPHLSTGCFQLHFCS